MRGERGGTAKDDEHLCISEGYEEQRMSEGVQGKAMCICAK